MRFNYITLIAYDNNFFFFKKKNPHCLILKYLNMTCYKDITFT